MDYRNINMSTLVEIFDYSRKQMDVWAKEKGLPSLDDKARKKRYDSRAVHDWFVKREIDKITKDFDEDEANFTGDGSPNLEKYRYYMGETKKFDLRVKKGEYIEREKVILDLRLLVEHAMKSLQMLGKEMAFKLSTETDLKVIQEMIDSRVIEILEGISLSRIPDSEEAEEE